MTDHSRRIEQFVVAVRRRINRHRLWTTLIWAMALGAAATVGVGLFYTLQGYAVPGGWIVGLAGVSFVIAVAAWAARRYNNERASHFADRHFDLKDSVTSFRHFDAQDRHDGYYALQANDTTKRVADLDHRKIAYRLPRRVLAVALGLLAVAVFLGMQGPSEEVKERLALEEFTQEATLAINEELAELVEELKKETTDAPEEKLLEPDKLRRWVDELKETRDQKEALRQYARLERKLDKARLALNRRKDEQLLDRAAKELKKSPETKKLGEKLQQKKYDNAADQMEKMKPQAKQSPEKKQLEKRRRELARLKAMSQRLAAAARSSKSPSQGKNSSAKQSNKSGKQSKSNKSSPANNSSKSGGNFSGGDSEGSELAEAIEDLAESVEDMDEMLKKACDSKKCDEKLLKKCQSCQGDVGDQLDKLSKCLKRLGTCRRADKKLCKLKRACGQCQGKLCNGCCSGSGTCAGGLKPGWGSNTARRDQTDELVDNGQTTQLKGIKGQGPSMTSVESADSGSGVSTRRSKAKQREFKRQAESFVQREDVPEQVKQGVKRYFQIIHENELETSNKEDSNE
ncbi:MAG: hypothetical protein JXM70_03395 [Pirellulales bacterium]|nr:hypothetical protein [Pirellulales bacterium]